MNYDRLMDIWYNSVIINPLKGRDVHWLHFAIHV